MMIETRTFALEGLGWVSESCEVSQLVSRDLYDRLILCEQSPLPAQSSHPAIPCSWSIGACDRGAILAIDEKQYYTNELEGYNHCDPVHLRLIRFVVVPVKSLFADCEGSLDCGRVFVANGSSGKMLVDVIHGRDDSGNAGCPSGKE